MRFILCNKTFKFKDLCEKLQEHYGDKYPIKTNELEECPPENLRFKNVWGHKYDLDNSKSTEILGIKYYDIKDTVVDMAETMIGLGMLPDNRNK